MIVIYTAHLEIFDKPTSVHVLQVVTETGQVVELTRRYLLLQKECILLQSLSPLCTRHRGREHAV